MKGRYFVKIGSVISKVFQIFFTNISTNLLKNETKNNMPSNYCAKRGVSFNPHG